MQIQSSDLISTDLLHLYIVRKWKKNNGHVASINMDINKGPKGKER